MDALLCGAASGNGDAMRALCVIVQDTPVDAAAASNGLSPYFSRLLDLIPCGSLAFSALVERAAKDVLGLVVLSLERLLSQFNRLPAIGGAALVQAMNSHVLCLSQHDYVDAVVAHLVQRVLCCTRHHCVQHDKRQKLLLDDYVDRGASSVGGDSPEKRIRIASLLQC